MAGGRFSRAAKLWGPPRPCGRTSKWSCRPSRQATTSRTSGTRPQRAQGTHLQGGVGRGPTVSRSEATDYVLRESRREEFTAPQPPREGGCGPDLRGAHQPGDRQSTRHTKRTADTHVGGILRKLGLRPRRRVVLRATTSPPEGTFPRNLPETEAPPRPCLRMRSLFNQESINLGLLSCSATNRSL